MRRELMDILACPVCKGELTLTVTETETDHDGAEEIIAGTLHCAGCNEDYPIAGGIPNLLPPDVRRAMEAEEAAAPERGPGS